MRERRRRARVGRAGSAGTLAARQRRRWAPGSLVDAAVVVADQNSQPNSSVIFDSGESLVRPNSGAMSMCELGVGRN